MCRTFEPPDPLNQHPKNLTPSMRLNLKPQVLTHFAHAAFETPPLRCPVSLNVETGVDPCFSKGSHVSACVVRRENRKDKGEAGGGDFLCTMHYAVHMSLK